MSKIMKRTLTLVLTVCMLLSVVAIATPAKALGEEIVKFDFVASNGTNPRTTNPYTTLDAIPSGGWAFVGASNNSATASNTIGMLSLNGLYFDFISWYGGYSGQIVINIPEAGYYDVLSTFRTGGHAQQGGVQIRTLHIPKGNEDLAALVAAFQAKDGPNTKTSTSAELATFSANSGIYTTYCNMGTGRDVAGYTGVNYGGTQYFEAGNHLVVFTAWNFAREDGKYNSSDSVNGKTNCRTYLKTLEFVKTERGKAAGLQVAFEQVWHSGNGGIVTLMNPLNMSAVDYELTRNNVLVGNLTSLNSAVSELDLNGQNATFNSFAITGYKCLVYDTKGTGKIVTLGGQAPVLNAESERVAIKTAENTYDLFDLPKTTVKAGPVATDGTDADYAAGSDARFVFKATLDADALAAIAAGTQEVTIGANWKQGDKDLAATIFENEDVITWATGDNSTAKVFYIDVKGMDRLTSGETVTCTPYITIGSVTKTLAPITYTAA